MFFLDLVTFTTPHWTFVFNQIVVLIFSPAAQTESAGRRRLPTLPQSSRGNSPSYPSSSSRQDCGWLQVNVLYRNSHLPTFLTGQLTVLPLLQLHSKQDCGWLQVNVPYRNSQPYPPHGATHCPNPPPAPSRAVAGYTRWWMYCTETPTCPPCSLATHYPNPPPATGRTVAGYS